MAEATQPFRTNPAALSALPSDRILILRMRIKEVYKTGSNAPTGIVRARAFNGSAEGKKDYYVRVADGAEKSVGGEIFAARPLGGAGKTQASKPVEWVEMGGGGASFPQPRRRWDVLSVVDDAGTVQFTRSRFTIS